MPRVLAAAFALALASCAEDELHMVPCTADESAFDIEQVSALEDVNVISDGADAVLLDVGESKTADGTTWRVGTVDTLVMIPRSQFSSYPKTVEASIEVWDGDDPKTAPTWKVTQTLDRAALEWTQVEVPDGQNTTERNYYQAWWRFDFKALIPESGMTATKQYLVGVRWARASRPQIGYSHYNRPCSSNWTDYGDGDGWILNGVNSGSSCSWPMFRVNAEVTVQKTSCD